MAHTLVSTARAQSTVSRFARLPQRKIPRSLHLHFAIHCPSLPFGSTMRAQEYMQNRRRPSQAGLRARFNTIVHARTFGSSSLVPGSSDASEAKGAHASSCFSQRSQ
eukprot:6212894-Pleurochrysis_carterae.AAC.2